MAAGMDDDGLPTLQPSNLLSLYHDALRTPGIIPCSESSRKQMRQTPKRRRNARDRPHRPHRLCTRTLNFGFRLLFSIIAFRAI